MVKVSFKRQSFDLFYKNDHDGDEIQLCFMKDNFIKNNGNLPVFVPHTKPKGISLQRKNNLIKDIADITPSHKMVF